MGCGCGGKKAPKTLGEPRVYEPPRRPERRPFTNLNGTPRRTRTTTEAQ